jgi:hypothetical protein
VACRFFSNRELGSVPNGTRTANFKVHVLSEPAFGDAVACAGYVLATRGVSTKPNVFAPVNTKRKPDYAEAFASLQ